MFLANPFTGAFGLDIGDLSLKLIRLRRRHGVHGPQVEVAEIRTVPLQPGCIVNGEIQQPEMVRRKLLHLLGFDGSRPPLTARWVVADLPEPKTFLKLIAIDSPPESLLPDDVRYQAGKHLPFALEETYIDWQAVGQNSRRAQSQVLVGAVPKVTADAYTYLLESVNLEVLALEVEGIAIARSLITRAKEYQGEARGILDLGATRSSLIIYDHGTIQFSTTFNFSGEIISTALSQRLNLDYALAEQLKIQYGIAAAKEHPGYLKVVSGLVDNLVAEIKTTLAFYQEHFMDANPVTRIIICGGLAGLKGLETLLSQKLKIATHPGQAWKNISRPPAGTKEQASGLTLVSALGLALRALEHPLPTTL